MKLAWLSLLALIAVGGAAAASEFRLTSPDVADGAPIASPSVNRACNGANLSPALTWSGAPAGTRSFAVTVHDPDAPKSGGWWHWLAFDIPPSTPGLARGAAGGGLPAGARQGPNDYGDATYDGPCPPAGPPHRYAITLWALDVDRLAGIASVPPQQLAAQIRAHALGSATLTGTYRR
jgi:hypothetical protein